MRLREARPKYPSKLIAYLKTGQPERQDAKVVSASTEKGDQMAAGFKNPVRLAPYGRTGDERVP